MEQLKLNETPVRTSRNFGINNIKLEQIELPEHVAKFENVNITSKNGNAIISENTDKINLTYGNGKILEDQNNRMANNKIKIESNENDEINIVYDFDDNNVNLLNQINIIANGNIDVIVKYVSSTNKACFHNGIINVVAEKDSKVNVFVVNLLNEESQNFESFENEIKDNANVNYTIIDIGGKNSISNYYTNIVGVNGNNDIKTIYLGTDNQIKDINYIAELRGEKSEVDIDVQGALNNNAKKNFKGTIDFKKGCKKAKGNENEYCMLLSDEARSLALPMLLCTESDVEGNHSTASGKAQMSELFYIMSRGFSYKEAIKLIVKANFNKIIDRINSEELKNEILQEIDRRLD